MSMSWIFRHVPALQQEPVTDYSYSLKSDCSSTLPMELMLTGRLFAVRKVGCEAFSNHQVKGEPHASKKRPQGGRYRELSFVGDRWQTLHTSQFWSLAVTSALALRRNLR
jgi:hypothetical protein